MSKKILAINSGSSSLKFQLFEMPAKVLLAKGLFDRIGLAETMAFTGAIGSQKIQENVSGDTHQAAVDYLLHFLINHQLVTDLSEIKGVGHRIAHGGEIFKQSCLINQAQEQEIANLAELAPLHNPVNLLGIQAFRSQLPNCPQVGVFDTSFHQSMAKKDYLYAIPYRFYQQDKIRRYGFHGTSHKYIVQCVNEFYKNEQPNLKIIVCHIGNGASVCGIKNGQSVITSMGFTPLAGLMMGTRCGDIDPSILPFLATKEQLPAMDLAKMMNEQSGILGVSELSSDVRDLLQASSEGNERARLALDMYTSKIRQTIGAYAAELGGVDELVFTAGVGENSGVIRQMCCDKLQCLGVELSEHKNSGNEALISSSNSRVKVRVIPTNEELMIAKDTYKLIS